eukprot:9088410-Ditylum_brightwellii.AAC.2
MSCENISPTSASSTEDRKSCIVEQDFIWLRSQSQGTFTYDQSFKKKVSRVYHESSIIPRLASDKHKNKLYKKAYKKMNWVEKIFTQLPDALQTAQFPYKYLAGDDKEKIELRIAAASMAEAIILELHKEFKEKDKKMNKEERI